MIKQTERIEIEDTKLSIQTLTRECVVHLHELVSRNYSLLPDMEPVSPPGVKDENMLGSAVARQSTGAFGYYHYSNCFSNCAALVHSILKNHPFHNGNKRAGLLCTIKHLYENGYVLKDQVPKNEIFELLVAIVDKEPEDASNFVPNGSKKLPSFSKKHLNSFNRERKKSVNKNTNWDIDTQIEFIAYWLDKNTITKKIALKKLTSWDLKTVTRLMNKLDLRLDISYETKTIIIWKKRVIKLFGNDYYQYKTYKLSNIKSKYRLEKIFISQVLKNFSISIEEAEDIILSQESGEFVLDQIKAYKDLIYKLSLT